LRVVFLALLCAACAPAPCDNLPSIPASEITLDAEVLDTYPAMGLTLAADFRNLWALPARDAREILLITREDGTTSSFQLDAEIVDAQDLSAGPGPEEAPSVFLLDGGEGSDPDDPTYLYRFAEADRAPVITPDRIELRWPDEHRVTTGLVIDPRTGDILLFEPGGDVWEVTAFSGAQNNAIGFPQRVYSLPLAGDVLAAATDPSGGVVGVRLDDNRVRRWSRVGDESMATTLVRGSCAGPDPAEGYSLALDLAEMWALSTTQVLQAW